MICRGKLIVFEGCDRSGKTTQCNLAVKAFKKRNISAELIKFPERSTDIGVIINDYLAGHLTLTDQQIHLLFALNRKELITGMEEKLMRGTMLLVDRYSYSGIAYSSVKQDMDLSFCCLTEIGLTKPDLVLYLDSCVGVRSGRGEFGAEVYETVSIQNRVEEAYRKLFYRHMQVVDGEGSVEVVHDRVMHLLDTHLPTPSPSLQHFTLQDFNLEIGTEPTQKIVEETMIQSMGIIKKASCQNKVEKEDSLKRLTRLLLTVKC